MAVQISGTQGHQHLPASLAADHSNDVLCTSCGEWHSPTEMVVWYVNSELRPFGPGKGLSEVHYICNRDKCKAKINTMKKVGLT